MRARDRFRVDVVRGESGPAFLASPGRQDRVELVDLGEGELVAFWEVSPSEAKRLVRALREDLGELEEGAFLTKWGAA